MTELHARQRSPPAGVVDDLLDDSLDVAIALAKVVDAQLGGSLAVLVVRAEDESVGLSLTLSCRREEQQRPATSSVDADQPTSGSSSDSSGRTAANSEATRQSAVRPGCVATHIMPTLPSSVCACMTHLSEVCPSCVFCCLRCLCECSGGRAERRLAEGEKRARGPSKQPSPRRSRRKPSQQTSRTTSNRPKVEA